MDNFYVYLYIRENSTKHGAAGTPYYVGKGKGMRAFNRHHRVHTPKNLLMIVFVARDISEPAAHALEIETIAKYGRIDNGTGCLANLTDGGEGQSGRVVSEEEKERQRAYMLAHPERWLKPHKWTAEEIEKRSSKIRGRKRPPFSEEWLKKMSESRKGFKHSEETKAKASAFWSGRKRGSYSPERIEKVAASKRGKKASEETRARMSASSRHLGKGLPIGFKHSPETKEKMRQSALARIAKAKE